MLDSSNSWSTIRSPDQEPYRNYWKNRAQHLIFFLGYCVNMRDFCAFIYEDAFTNPVHAPTLPQIILVCVIVGGPLLFIQMFIGQFTQKGCIAIGAMVPAMYGFGYCMMMVALFDCVQNLMYTAAGFLYLLTSILNFPYPTWMYCTDEVLAKNPNCFSRSDIDLCLSCANEAKEPCFDPKQHKLSAALFRLFVAFEKDESIQDPAKIGLPEAKSTSHAFLTILLVYLLSCRRLQNMDLSLRISLVFCLLGITGTVIVALSDKNIWVALKLLGHLNLEAFGDIKSWMAAIRRVTEALKLSSGGHVILGSYMMPDTASHFRTVYLIGYYILLIIFFYCHYYLFDVLLQCRLNMPEYGVKTTNSIVFVLYPTKLGLAASPQLWCTLYFTVYFILSVTSMVLQVVLVDETLCDEFRIGAYSLYTRCALCITIFILCLPLLTKGGMLIARTLHHELKIINLLVITLTFIIIFLYNIQRLKDDIHFVLNTPPTWYIQTCWVVTAFITGMMFFYQLKHYQTESRLYVVRFAIYILIGSPLIIGFIVKLMQYVKNKNITGIFRPSVYYGPPDLSVKLMRLLFNPRLEVRYRRRKEMCKHRCLLDNEIVVRTIEKELSMINQIAEDLHNNEEHREEHADIIKQLREHYRVMNIRYAMMARQMKPNVKMYS